MSCISFLKPTDKVKPLKDFVTTFQASIKLQKLDALKAIRLSSDLFAMMQRSTALVSYGNYYIPAKELGWYGAMGVLPWSELEL